jgi:hypothetical protein
LNAFNFFDDKKSRKLSEHVVINGEKAIGLTIIRRVTVIRYHLSITHKGIRYDETFNDIEEAKRAYVNLKNQFANVNHTIVRNGDGIAILRCVNTKGILVDDETYLKYYTQSCFLIHGYPGVIFFTNLC